MDKSDFDYIIKQLYGQTGIPCEEYKHHLLKRYRDKEMLVNKYDILKPTRRLIEENQRYL